MDSDTPVDFALFQLSPRRSRCELFVSKDGKTEKLAAGLFKPFLSHLKAAEEQETQSTRTIKLDVERKRGHAGSWFHKGTLERFVRFVSTPEVLEVISTLDAETSQLEGAKRTYCEAIGDHLSRVSPGEVAKLDSTPADATKKELLRAIDVRLAAVKQELSAACARASAAGFTLESISDLRLFADYFGAQRLNIACSKFVSLCQRRPELISRPQNYRHQSSPPITWKAPPLPVTAFGPAERDVRGSSSSDMSIEDPEEAGSTTVFPSCTIANQKHNSLKKISSRTDSIQQQHKSSSSSKIEEETSAELAAPPVELSRRLSVQDRISMFENKQKEQSGGKVGGRSELRRQSSDLSSVVEKAVLRRWSGTSDMSLDLSGGNSNSSSRKEMDVVSDAPSSSASNPKVINNDENDTADSQPCSSSLRTVSIAENQREKAGSHVQQVQESAAPLNSSAVPSSSGRQKPKDVKVCLNESEASEDIGAIHSATLGSRLSQRIPLSEAEDPLNQSIDKNVIRNPKIFGKLGKVSGENRPNEEDSDFQEGKISVPEINNKSQLKSDSGFVLSRTPQSASVPRPYKGSQGLNEELQMKADELEKMFAAHKLRLQSDQGSVSKRGKTVEKIPLQEQSAPCRGPELGYKGIVGGNEGIVDSGKKSLFDTGFLEGSRGKFYEKYVQKREAKLKEEWDSNRDLKEGRMKKLQDDLERSKAEMARLTKSAGKLDLRTSSRRREEKLGVSSLNRSMKTREQVGLLTNKDDDDQDSSSLQTQRSRNVGDNSSRSGTSRGLLTSVGVSSSSHRVSARDIQTEGNFPGQSAPNSVDLRKENAKPSSGQAKDGARSQLRNSARSKSICEDIGLVNEDKNSRLSQSMRRPSPVVSDSITHGDLRPPRNIQTRVTRSAQGPRRKPGLTSGSAHKLKHVTREEAEEQEEAAITPDSWEEEDDGDDDDDDGDLASVQVNCPASNKISSSSVALGSPRESTGSWNSSGGSPTQADASRTRKKWVNTHKPIMVSNSSNQLQKDSPSKGFKRLLSLGRKQKGVAEGQIIDWVSAPTGSEEDDDAEDGLSLESGLSNKPRAGHLSHFHFVQDGFNDSDQFYEQGSRSLFALSSIRAKGARARPV
ncbi:GPI-anchored adhesin-like protein isoform X2 [Wolffia australiana]